ncbi:S41 family peptidase [Aquimarina algiphila]|uniref:S41 family peptidase n=1 Tax=Aquimarina algiphila TaxID=2047982 RepID=UPI00232ECD7A|nr:S41 family peptidase [Aquimarina algiphila]
MNQIVLNKRYFIVTLFLLLLFQGALYAQNKISKNLLQEDLDILKVNLERMHPGLYKYSSAEEIEAWFTNTKKNLKDTMTAYEFYKAVAPLNSVIKNGHTKVNYPSFEGKFNLIPIRIYKDNDSYYILESFNEAYQELIGREITAINDISMQDIFKELIKNRTRDGENLTFPSDKLMYFFSLDYSLQFGSSPSYKIKLVDQEKLISLKGMLLTNEVIKKHYSRFSTFDKVDFKIKDSIAILKVPVFAKFILKKSNYRKVFRDAFEEISIKNINHLIIDVRGNLGGDTGPTLELISYLYDKDFRFYSNILLKKNKIDDKQYYKKQGVFWLNLFSWVKLKKVKNSYYSLRNDEGMTLYSPQKKVYNGNLYILTNGTSFSATGEFTSFIKDHHKEVVFIGEEVGGNKNQNTSGESFTITLPNSKLRVDIPVVLWVMNIKEANNGHGVVPDYPVRNTIQDELDGRDRVMEFTLDLIQKPQ